MTCATSVPLGTTSLPVHVEADGAALAGARVTFHRAGDVYSTGLTDAAGNVTLTLQPETLGPIVLTVTGYNCRPFQGTVEAVAATGLALAERSLVVDDDGSDGTVGNGDGHWDAGETVDLYPVLANVGSSSARNLSGTLSTTDPLVTVLQATADYGTVAVGDSASPGTGLRVRLPFDAGDQREVPLTLNLRDSNQRTFVATYRPTTRAPELRHYRHTVVDTGGDSDQVPDPGETIAYYPVLNNLGTGAAVGVTAKLRSPDGLATVTDSTVSWGDVSPGAEVTGDAFVFLLSSTAAQLELVVSDAYGERLRQTLDVVAPPVPASLGGMGGEGYISLTWAHLTVVDLLGYNVYRSTESGGVFSRVNEVPTDRISYFQDGGLAALDAAPTVAG